MDADQTNQAELIDTTDCLEAINVFKGWKNFLFLITFLALLLLQTSFWLVDTGYIKTAQPRETADATQAVQLAEPVTETPSQAPAEKPAADTNDAAQIKKAAQVVTAEANLPVPAQPAEPAKAAFTVKFEYIALAMRLLNYILALAAVLYCLTLLFSLKVSLLGRLGGINHIARAFFRSLLMLVLLLPWQRLFGGVIAGAMFTPDDLIGALAHKEDIAVFSTAFYYLRFSGYWLVIVILLISSQIRSSRWAGAILRRLGII